MQNKKIKVEFFQDDENRSVGRVVDRTSKEILFEAVGQPIEIFERVGHYLGVMGTEDELSCILNTMEVRLRHIQQQGIDDEQRTTSETSTVVQDEQRADQS